jgi:tRNA-dihydrouridine synthase
LREAVGIKLTVKTRLGFATVDEFDGLQAVETLPCPVIANGHVYSAAQAQDLLSRTGAAGLMIGRGAIRNPWLFNQIRQQLRGETVRLPTGRDVAHYIRALWQSQTLPGKPEKTQCERMKKFLNFLGEGVPGAFLSQIRRSQTAAEFHDICRHFLDHDEPMPLLPAELIDSPVHAVAV